MEPTPSPSATPAPTLVPTPSPTPTPTPVPILKPLPADFTEEWGINWKQIPAGNYTLTFEDPANDPQAVIPGPLSLEVKEKATTEVKVSGDGKVLDCIDGATRIGSASCLKYYPDSSIPSGQLRVGIVPAKDFKITVSANQY